MSTATGTRLTSARGLLTNGLTTVVILYVVLYAVYSRMEAGALSASAFGDLVNNSIPLAIAAAGATFVILLGGFDLSVAGVLSLVKRSACHSPDGRSERRPNERGDCNRYRSRSRTLQWNLRRIRGLQSIAVTLAMMILTRGLALVILDAPGGSVSDWISDTLTNSLWGVVPASGLVALAVAALWAIFRRTNTGVALYAVGKDQTAAALSGINVKRTKCIAFVLAGALYGLAGFMLSAQTASGDPNAGSTLLLLVFASVALGGTAFTGGQGGLYGSMIGAATLMLLQKVLFSSGIQSFYTGLFQGFVMVVAVIFVNLITYMARRNREHA